MRLVIDTDPGIDDALALLLAFGWPGAHVEVITTVAGNAGIDRVTANARRILNLVEPPMRPRLARGTPAPLGRPLVVAPEVNGEDGLGDLEGYWDPGGRLRDPDPPVALEMHDAADLILELARGPRRDLTLVALGPLTNLATALGRDRAGLSGFGRIVIMGGAVDVPGNVTPAAEFNFYVDPEAAAAVFAAGLPLEVVPLDVTHRVVLSERHLAGCLGHAPSRVAHVARDLARRGLDLARARGEDGIALHDPLALGVALDPTLVTFEPLHVEVECEGRLTRGLSLADRRPGRTDRRRPPNCRVATGVDGPRFLRLFLEGLCPASW